MDFEACHLTKPSSPTAISDAGQISRRPHGHATASSAWASKTPKAQIASASSPSSKSEIAAPPTPSPSSPAADLGKRALKIRDWGKMAATFIDLSTQKAIRIAALESSKDRKRRVTFTPKSKSKNAQQMHAYRHMPDRRTRSPSNGSPCLSTPAKCPRYKSPRITCAQCGEGINYDRQVTIADRILCTRPAPTPPPVIISRSPKPAG